MTEINKMATGQISIHALLAESDDGTELFVKCQIQFLSTLSLRRATSRHTRTSRNDTNFYPRSPCGERLAVPRLGKRDIRISIHALLAESDKAMYTIWACMSRFLSTLSLRRATRPYYPQSRPLLFLSTLSLRRATGAKIHDPGQVLISIHALLAESDSYSQHVT